jgi:uncharacterized protein (TIGR02271 family)
MTDVFREDGQRGVIVERFSGHDGAPHVMVEFADGLRVAVPESLLLRQDDGSYRLPRTQNDTAQALGDSYEDGDQIVIPVVAEEMTVQKRSVTAGIVRAHKRVESVEEVVDEPLLRERVSVEHIAVNQLVEGEAPVARYEQGVLVIPILEEVLVVEKRLYLKEEVRLTKRRETVREPQRVTLRREVVDIERVAGEDGARAADGAEGV